MQLCRTRLYVQAYTCKRDIYNICEWISVKCTTLGFGWLNFECQTLRFNSLMSMKILCECITFCFHCIEASDVARCVVLLSCNPIQICQKCPSRYIFASCTVSGDGIFGIKRNYSQRSGCQKCLTYVSYVMNSELLIILSSCGWLPSEGPMYCEEK